jgi:putative oxidoreductase
VPLLSLIGLAGIIEVVTGVLLVLGFQTRLVAFIASGEMAFAYFLRHAPQGFWPDNNGGEPAVLYCFVFLYLVFAGAGRLALDKR